MIGDPLLLSVLACIGAAIGLAYLLGRYHGLETGLRITDEAAGDWPTAGDARPFTLLNDLRHGAGD